MSDTGEINNSMTQHSAQIAIIGGGISGLWLLNSLRNAGYDAVLFEKNALGSQQTFASQGMIHGGIKYALCLLYTSDAADE